jgi:hypothetical protein
VSLITVSETAAFLHVSVSWVRCHLAQLPVVPMLGRMIRVDSEKLQSRMDSRKPLEPRRIDMIKNRYQRGGVFKDGKNKDMWKGTWWSEERFPNGKRKPVKVTLGSVKELPTKTSARSKLTQIMNERMKPGAAVSAKVKKFSEMVTEWKETEGVTLGRSTLANYSNTLRACVLPTFKDRDIKTINRKAIQDFLTKQAKTYSKSYLKSMRVTLCMTLAWAEQATSSNRMDGLMASVSLGKRTGGKSRARN